MKNGLLQISLIDPKNVWKKQNMISNYDLVIEKIPNPEDPSWDWIKFAFTIKGY